MEKSRASHVQWTDKVRAATVKPSQEESPGDVRQIKEATGDGKVASGSNHVCRDGNKQQQRRSFGRVK